MNVLWISNRVYYETIHVALKGRISLSCAEVELECGASTERRALARQ